MLAFVAIFGIFAVLSLIGAAVLASLGVRDLGLSGALIAPSLGSAALVIPFFIASRAGLGLQTAGPVIVGVFILASLGVLAVRLPRIPVSVLPTGVAIVVSAFLIGWPMFVFGFGWVANANDDMANYVLSAKTLMAHGVAHGLDVTGLSSNRDLASSLRVLSTSGVRPGADMFLAAASATLGRGPYEAFMPLILAFNLTTIAAAAALALQGCKRWPVAAATALVLAISPLATYGIVQELLPQVWALGLACALFAVLLRFELHTQPLGWRAGVVVALFVIALAISYPELASTLVLAYFLFLCVAAFRRRLALRAVLLLWTGVLAAVLIILNTYGAREFAFMRLQARHGLGVGPGVEHIFGYALLPSALPAIIGLEPFSVSQSTPLLGTAIVVAFLVLVVVVVVAVRTLWSVVAASCALVAYALLAMLLAIEQSDFGLFKLYMYVQPFLVAAACAWIGRISRRGVAAGSICVVVVIAAIGLRTQYGYVSMSTHPGDLAHASDPRLFPAFARIYGSSASPVIAAGDNPFLMKIEAARIPSDAPLFFIGRNVMTPALDIYSNLQPQSMRADAKKIRAQDGWTQVAHVLQHSSAKRVSFQLNRRAETAIQAKRCVLVAPSGREVPFNRRSFPERPTTPLLTDLPCAETHEFLAFVVSSLGESFYGFSRRPDVSYYQLEPDYFYPHQTFSGFGRYALFRVFGKPPYRIVLDYTATVTQRRNDALAPASVIGMRRTQLGAVGSGSARLVSPVVKPFYVEGSPYVLVDMGVPGELPVDRRSGVVALYGTDIPADERYLTSYVRDVSLVDSSKFERRVAPLALTSFPGSLSDPALIYSGIYEDGWESKRSYAVLGTGESNTLVFRANVLPTRERQRLTIRVSGRVVFNGVVTPGALELNLPVRSRSRDVRVDLTWRTATTLGPKDPRPAVARIGFLGFSAPPSRVTKPTGFAAPGVAASGIFTDGWAAKRSSFELAGGHGGELVLRGLVPGTHEKQVTVGVGGRRLGRFAVQPGPFVIRAPVRAATNRTITIAWDTAGRISATDARAAAARLVYAGVVGVEHPARISIPADLGDPRIDITGILADGWSTRVAHASLTGGPASTLTVAGVSPFAGQRLTVSVGGTEIARRAVRRGPFSVSIRLPENRSPRDVTFAWRVARRLSPADPRIAAVRLTAIAVAPGG